MLALTVIWEWMKKCCPLLFSKKIKHSKKYSVRFRKMIKGTSRFGTPAPIYFLKYSCFIQLKPRSSSTSTCPIFKCSRYSKLIKVAPKTSKQQEKACPSHSFWNWARRSTCSMNNKGKCRPYSFMSWRLGSGFFKQCSGLFNSKLINKRCSHS